jgi:hypothetical protein
MQHDPPVECGNRISCIWRAGQSLVHLFFYACQAFCYTGDCNGSGAQVANSCHRRHDQTRGGGRHRQVRERRRRGSRGAAAARAWARMQRRPRQALWEMQEHARLDYECDSWSSLLAQGFGQGNARAEQPARNLAYNWHHQTVPPRRPAVLTVGGNLLPFSLHHHLCTLQLGCTPCFLL